MTKRISILLALAALIGGSGYLLSTKLRSPDVSANSTGMKSRSEPGLLTVTIPEGTEIETRLLETLSTRTNRVGDHFSASIERPVRVDGLEVIPVGAVASGVVTSVKESGKIKGRSYISLRLESIKLRNGRRLEVATNAVSRLGKSNRNRNLALLGGGAGIGAAIGALAGGGKGVAIGGPVGLGAGLAAKALIRGHEVTIPSETLLHFRLEEAMHVKMS